MPAPVLPRLAERIRTLLAAGLSLRQISLRTGVGRATIHRIRHCRWRPALTAADIHDDRPPGFERENLLRCPSCGGNVYLWPCLRCEIAAQRLKREEIQAALRHRKKSSRKPAAPAKEIHSF